MKSVAPMNFISCQDTQNCPCFYRGFPADTVIKAELEITGLGLYRAFLNGQRIGDKYLTPGCNDYDAYLRVQRYDILPLLRADNLLEVVVGDGWYKGRFGLPPEINNWGDDARLAARLTMTLSDGSVSVINTDEQWRVRPSRIVSTSIYDGEARDDTLPIAEGKPCTPIEYSPNLVMDETAPIRCVAVLKARLLVSKKGERILDFGQNMAGVVRFTCREKRGSRVTLRFGEVLQDGCFYRDNLRSAKAEYVYISDGIDKQIEPLFTYYGFRYVLVEGIETVNSADFEAFALCSDLEETLEVETDSEKLNRLMRNSLWGQRSNFLDVPTDCPQRDERMGWTADAQVFMRTACYQMNCKTFYQKYFDDLRVEQTRYFSGDIPAYAPSVKGRTLPGGAVWADAAVIMPWQLYRQYGDIHRLAEDWPLMRDYAQTLIDKDKALGGRHIIDSGFTFGDWLALDGMTEQSVKGGTDDTFIRTAYYWNSIHLTSLAAEALNYTDDAIRYAALADEIHAAFLDEYITPNGHLSVNTQCGYVLALYFGLYRNRDVLVADLKKRLLKDGYQIKCGFTGAPLMLPVLLQNGLVDEAFRLLYREEFPGWLYEVNLGATTIWERWNSLLPDGTVSDTGMNSFNHYAYGSVCEAIYGDIAGLREETPGWRSAVIHPRFHWRMRNIRLRYQSPSGAYTVAWRVREDGLVLVEAEIPEGCTALVTLPDRAPFKIAGGSHRWVCQPNSDLARPFSCDTPLTDLAKHPITAAVLKERAPSLLAAASSPELRVLSPREVASINPSLPYMPLDALDKALRLTPAHDGIV